MAVATGTIQVKYSSTTGNSPSTLLAGELAVNLIDNKFWVGTGSANNLLINAPSSANTQVIYNSSGTLVGSANHTWNNSTNTLGITGAISASTSSVATTLMVGQGSTSGNAYAGNFQATGAASVNYGVSASATGATINVAGSFVCGTGANDLSIQTQGRAKIAGNADVVQLSVLANSSQNSNLQNWCQSGGTVLAYVDNTGNFNGVSFTGAGSGLTALNAGNLASGTVPIGRLGASGTPSASTFLSGTNVWTAITPSAGSDTQVIYNDLGVLSGNANLIWNYAGNWLQVTGGIIVSGSGTVGGTISVTTSTNTKAVDITSTCASSTYNYGIFSSIGGTLTAPSASYAIYSQATTAGSSNTSATGVYGTATGAVSTNYGGYFTATGANSYNYGGVLSATGTATNYGAAIGASGGTTNIGLQVSGTGTSGDYSIQATGKMSITGYVTGAVQLVVNGPTGQTGHLQEWQVNSSVLAYVDNTGTLAATNLVAAGNLTVTGTRDVCQLQVIGYTGQTNNLEQWQSSIAVVATMGPTGYLTVAGLGIGATNSSYALAIATTTLNTAVNIQQAVTSGNNVAVLAVSNGSGATQNVAISGTATGASSHNFALSLASGTGSGDYSIYATGKAIVFGNMDGKQLQVRANSTQTANLQEWQNSSGTALASVGPIGLPLDDTGLTTRKFIYSRAQNLITNGSGLLGTNYNFDGTGAGSNAFTFDNTNVYSGGGSFKYAAASGTIISTELIPVTPSNYYRLSAWVMSGDPGGANYNATNSQYYGICPYDIDGNQIAPQYYYQVGGAAQTTLAAQLLNGATTMTLTSATGWYNGDPYYYRNIIWWPYLNAEGYSYPNYTYSRNSSQNYSAYYYSPGMWAAGGISGNTVTLTAPWPGPTLPAGTPVSNNFSGSTYKYVTIGGSAVPNAWTYYSNYIGGWDTTGSGASNLFPYGTAFVRLVFLANYAPTTGNNIRYSDIWFSEMSSWNLEAATATNPGVVSTGSQTFAGTKTFNYTIYSTQIISNNGNANSFGCAPVAGAILAVNSNQPSNTGLAVQGVSGQTANLQVWQSYTGSVLANITSAGIVNAPGVTINQAGSAATSYGVNLTSTATSGTAAYGYNVTMTGAALYNYGLNINCTNGTSGNIGAKLVVSSNTSDYSLIASGAVIINGLANVQQLQIRSITSQTVNIQEWQNSSGTALSSVSGTGVFTGNGSGLTTLNASNISSGTLAAASLPSTAVQSYRTTFTSASSGMPSALVVTHNLGQQMVSVTVIDSGGNICIPTNIIFTSGTALTLNMTDITVTGTWNIVVMG